MDIQISLSMDEYRSDSQVMELYLFRHGYTRYNLEHRYQGISDIPLLESESERLRPFFIPAESDAGEQLAANLHRSRKHVLSTEAYPGHALPDDPVYQESGINADPVYVSPALRARQTAGILFPGREQIVVLQFAEMDFGIFEGRSADEMKEDPQYRSWVDSMCEAPIPQGECKAEYTERVTERFCKIVEDAFHRGRRRVLIVAHGGTQMVVMERFCVERRPYWTWKLEPGEGICAYIHVS